MKTITVSNQSELDAACERQKDDASIRIEIREWTDSSRAVLRGSSSAVLYGSSGAVLYGSSRAELYGSSSAVLYGSSRAELWDSSGAVLYGSSRAELWDSSGAVLYGSSSAVLWDSSGAVLYGSSHADASARAAIHLMSKHATVNGGVVIDCTEPITTIEAACDEWMLTPKRGRITVYKAVNDKLESERGFACGASLWRRRSRSWDCE